MRKEVGDLRWRGGRECSVAALARPCLFQAEQYEKALRLLKRSKLWTDRSDIHFDIALVELSQDHIVGLR